MSFTVTISVENADRIRASLGAVRTWTVPTMAKTARRGVWVHVVPETKTLVATQSGIGRRIWGENPSGLTSQGLVKQGKLKFDTVVGRTTLLLRGIPALLEEGGRIKPHTIRNGFGRKGKPMYHPGMTLRAHKFGSRMLERGLSSISTEVNEALAEMLRRHGF